MLVKATRWNERLKLAASFLNGLALAMLALGVIGPLAYLISDHDLMALDLAVTYAVASIVMHLIAQWVIGELEVE